MAIQTYRFSANKFSSMKSLNFSAVDYSKLKFGSKRVAREFGHELASKFFQSPVLLKLIPQIHDKKIAIMSAPWRNIGVASTALKDYFFGSFNPNWSENFHALEDLKVYRAHSYNEDYGAMEQDARKKAIGSDDFHIDREFVRDKVLFCIDDVIISGAHEERMLELITKSGFEGIVVFIYYAEYLGKDNPQIENDLNFAFVKSILDIDYIIKNDEFIFNTRTVKYILNADHTEFKNFADYQAKTFLHSLRKELTGNEYHKLPEFKENYEYLQTKLQ